MKQIAVFESSIEIARGPDDKVHREGGFNRQADLDRLIKFVSTRHHNENVHVAVLVGLSICMRAKEDDLLRLKSLGHLPRETPNCGLRYVRPAIPPPRPLVG
jgi:hypothetical protein